MTTDSLIVTLHIIEYLSVTQILESNKSQKRGNPDKVIHSSIIKNSIHSTVCVQNNISLHHTSFCVAELLEITEVSFYYSLY